MDEESAPTPTLPQGGRENGGWVEVREPHTGKLLFRYDAKRQLVEVVRRGKPLIVDLMQYGVEEETARKSGSG